MSGLVNGLQNRPRRFESARNLKRKESGILTNTRFFTLSIYYTISLWCKLGDIRTQKLLKAKDWHCRQIAVNLSSPMIVKIEDSIMPYSAMS